MTWTKLDDGFNDDPTLLRLPRGARLLHIEALVWCNKQETDGRIPIYAVRRITDEPDVDAAVEQLVGVGLWQAVDDDIYQLPGWVKDERGRGKHQRSADELKRARDGNAFVVGRRRLHQRGVHEWCTKGSRICPDGWLSQGDAGRYSRGESDPPDLTCPDPKGGTGQSSADEVASASAGASALAPRRRDEQRAPSFPVTVVDNA